MHDSLISFDGKLEVVNLAMRLLYKQSSEEGTIDILVSRLLLLVKKLLHKPQRTVFFSD